MCSFAADRQKPSHAGLTDEQREIVERQINERKLWLFQKQQAMVRGEPIPENPATINASRRSAQSQSSSAQNNGDNTNRTGGDGDNDPQGVAELFEPIPSADDSNANTLLWPSPFPGGEALSLDFDQIRAAVSATTYGKRKNNNGADAEVGDTGELKSGEIPAPPPAQAQAETQQSSSSGSSQAHHDPASSSSTSSASATKVPHYVNQPRTKGKFRRRGQLVGQGLPPCSLFKCEHCDLSFSDDHLLEEHTAIMHESHVTQKHHCKVCLMETPSALQQREHHARHVTLTTAGNSQFCDICFVWFPSLEGMVSHREMHIVDKCPLCGIREDGQADDEDEETDDEGGENSTGGGDGNSGKKKSKKLSPPGFTGYGSPQDLMARVEVHEKAGHGEFFPFVCYVCGHTEPYLVSIDTHYKVSHGMAGVQMPPAPPVSLPPDTALLATPKLPQAPPLPRSEFILVRPECCSVES